MVGPAQRTRSIGSECEQEARARLTAKIYPAKRAILLASSLLLIWAPSSFAQSETTITLDQAISEALARSPVLAVERNAIGLAAGTLRQARIYPFNPELELEGRAGRARGRVDGDERRGVDSRGFGVSQTIWLRGQRGLRVRAAEAELGRAEGLVKDAERQVIGDALRAFGEALVGQERVAVARDIVALATDVRDTAGKLAEAGDVPDLDVFRADVELNKARNRLLTEERNLRTAQRELALVLGRPADEAIHAHGAIILPSPPGEVAGFQQTAVERRPDLVAARAAARAAQAELELVRAEQVLPEMKIGLKYDEAREFDSINRTALLVFSVPLPLFNRRQGDIDRAAAALRQQQAAIELARRRIEKEVATTEQQARASRQITDAYTTRILPQQDRNFRLLREGYNLGQFRLTDVFVGQRELIEGREGYLDAVAALNTATADLYRALNSRP